MEETVRVAWSRAELTTVRDAVDLTPNFEGRAEVRNAVRGALRPRRVPSEVVLPRDPAERFARRFVSVDLPTSLARLRLLDALRESATAATSRGAESPRAA
jgi:hypothetical protein